MRRAGRIRNASWLLRILSMVTMAALVVAPACASLCGGQNCRQGDAPVTKNGGCHEAGTMPGGAARISRFSSCSSAELPAVVLTPTSLRKAFSVSRLSAPDGILLAVEQLRSAAAAPSPDFHSGGSPDFLSSLAYE